MARKPVGPPVSARIPIEDYQFIHNLAIRNGQRVSDVLRDIIKRGIMNHEMSKMQQQNAG